MARNSVVLVAVFGLLLASTPTVHAELVSTSEALALEEVGTSPATGDLVRARESLAADLAELGVDPEVAQLRVSMLSAAEIEEVAGRLQELPAGGSVVGVLGVTFIVLLVLELVGVIDIFKKI